MCGRIAVTPIPTAALDECLSRIGDRLDAGLIRVRMIDARGADPCRGRKKGALEKTRRPRREIGNDGPKSSGGWGAAVQRCRLLQDL